MALENGENQSEVLTQGKTLEGTKNPLLRNETKTYRVPSFEAKKDGIMTISEQKGRDFLDELQNSLVSINEIQKFYDERDKFYNDEKTIRLQNEVISASKAVEKSVARLLEKIGEKSTYSEYLKTEIEKSLLETQLDTMKLQLVEYQDEAEKCIKNLREDCRKPLDNLNNILSSLNDKTKELVCSEDVINSTIENKMNAMFADKNLSDTLDKFSDKLQEETENYGKLTQDTIKTLEENIKTSLVTYKATINSVKEASKNFIKQCASDNQQIADFVTNTKKTKTKDILLIALSCVSILSYILQLILR